MHVYIVFDGAQPFAYIYAATAKEAIEKACLDCHGHLPQNCNAQLFEVSLNIVPSPQASHSASLL
jgi:hypothetical protein